MKVKKLTACIAKKITEGKLWEESKVLSGSDAVFLGWMYIYSPDMFHMVCMSNVDNFYRKEVQDALDTSKRILARIPDCEWAKRNLVERTEQVGKVNDEWKDALVI